MRVWAVGSVRLTFLRDRRHACSPSELASRSQKTRGGRGVRSLWRSGCLEELRRAVAGAAVWFSVLPAPHSKGQLLNGLKDLPGPVGLLNNNAVQRLLGGP